MVYYKGGKSFPVLGTLYISLPHLHFSEIYATIALNSLYLYSFHTKT